MNYIEIKDCKKGYILKGESNYKVYKDEQGITIRGNYLEIKKKNSYKC